MVSTAPGKDDGHKNLTDLVGREYRQVKGITVTTGGSLGAESLVLGR